MSIKYAILGLLNYTDMHGYRIKEHIEKNFGHMWSINFGQIYPNLKDLEKDGLIRMIELSPSDDGGPHKKLYSITEKGVEEFSRWLSESPERPMLIRDPFLLKFTFFGFGDSGRALELIDEQIALYEAQLHRRRKNFMRWEHQGVYARLLAELGITQNEMYLEWLRNARAEIEKNSSEAVLEKV
ncbi:MAG TPA: PadR family transcriptional regulator [Spirochaetota bacterium]|nr:PadR family transcriptional regulator [Spirochaetota bacterium]HPV39998.1 PadR family transcriptional regulator [Spirochaetota bacterium]